jgi:drug/metabolite transporter (DMT)-like permease
MLGATMCWASAGALVRTQQLGDPWEITFWRSLFMAVFMLAVLRVQHGSAAWRRVRDIGRPGVVSGVLWATMFVCFIVALTRTTVANVLVLGSLSPFTAALFAWALLGERPPGRTWLAIVAACGGIAMMFVDAVGGGGASGNLIALGIPLCFGLNVVVLRRSGAAADMAPTLLLAGVFSCAMTLPFALPIEARGLDFANLIALGFVQLGLGCLLMILALRHLQAAEVGLLSVMEIVFGVLSTWLLVGEAPSALALAGGLVVVVALAVNAALGLLQRPAVPATVS